ncbi:MAG: DNA-protecting protein DprA [Ignavibacteriales bacterium]|nr:DNA-protecting protein DprA [Ignavibacteriales bacterium]
MNQERFKKLSYLKQLYSIEGIGPQKIFSLLSKFQSIEQILNSRFNDLVEVDGINKILAAKIINASESINSTYDQLENELESLEKIDARLISYFDEEYPSLLKNIYFPPLFLYIKGSFNNSDLSSIAIVGTREPTSYGRNIAESFASELALKGITTISGLARGIDTIVHSATIKANGRTIAIIGSGLDVIYPSENKKLFNEITENGVVISEYQLGTKPDAQNFPRRNRIISGMSIGTLVVETKINGGAMSTANYALDQGREVFAVPGMISSKCSEGPNLLIQKGSAKLVTKIEDMLDELRIQFRTETDNISVKPQIELNLFEEKIYSVIKDEQKQIDEISLLSGISTSDCLVHLLSMEFKGVVRQRPGKVFSID